SAGSPGGVDRLLRSKGAGLSSYTSPIGMLGGALGGDFGPAVQGHESAQLKQALGKWIGDYLIQTFAEGRLYP
ncbi:MAG TPA: hypothetical protein VMV41_05220, partial [Cellulomonadaceae bacterium]|nr:hypothetical protein [Cellulomonadaceae bacterium]